MSLVGTRPPLISETNLYELHHKARLAIKPGITGMWQVSGRSEITDFEEVVRLDREYITNWNIGMDAVYFRRCLEMAFEQESLQMSTFYYALQEYSKKYPMKAVLANNWFDIGHEDKYYNSKLEVRAREFNHITIDKNRGILKKTSDDKDKFIGEIKWYLKLPADVEYVRPRIFDYSTSYVNPYVSMEYYA